MKTGFKELDQIIDINEGNLIILAGSARTGKSTFAFSIVRNIVNTYDKSVLYFNLETSKETIMSNFIKDNLKLKNNIIIDDSSKISLDTICEKTRELKEKNNIGFLLIDYLQLIKDYNKEDITNIVLKLKKLSKDLEIPILVNCCIEDGIPNIYEADIILFLYRIPNYAYIHVIKNEDRILRSEQCRINLIGNE